jgi:hypothetical protein
VLTTTGTTTTSVLSLVTHLPIKTNKSILYSIVVSHSLPPTRSLNNKMPVDRKHMKIGVAALAASALIIGLSVGLTQKNRSNRSSQMAATGYRMSDCIYVETEVDTYYSKSGKGGKCKFQILFGCFFFGFRTCISVMTCTTFFCICRFAQPSLT